MGPVTKSMARCLDRPFDCTPGKARQANNGTTEETSYSPAIFVNYGASAEVLARFQWAASRELAPARLLCVLGLDTQDTVGPRVQGLHHELGCTTLLRQRRLSGRKEPGREGGNERGGGLFKIKKKAGRAGERHLTRSMCSV
jgi:hypothetical protein